MTADTGPVPPPRFRRAVVAAAVVVAVLGGGAAGWALHAAAHPTPADPTTGTGGANTPPGGTAGAHTSSQGPSAPAARAFTPSQARQRACDAYAALGVEWAGAYDEWLSALPPDWRWSDAAVTTATAQFRTAAVSIAGQLFALVAPNTPAEVAEPVTGYGDAILSLAASHDRVSSADTNTHLDAVDAAGAAASTACGLASE